MILKTKPFNGAFVYSTIARTGAPDQLIMWDSAKPEAILRIIRKERGPKFVPVEIGIIPFRVENYG
jgi:hypothetical protein